MATERYAFDRPAKVSLFMAHLYHQYMSYAPNSFPFEFLQKTSELEVRCRGLTGGRKETTFPTSPELLKAIRGCERVNGRLTNNWGFSGFMDTATHEVIKKVPITESENFSGPLFGNLGVGIMIESSRCIGGNQLFYLHDNHWSCIMRDWTFYTEEQVDRKDHIRKSEILAVTSIFCRQMNKMVWNPDKRQYIAKPRYEKGLLTATVATFIYGQVRIVQATLNPSEKYPTLTFMLRAIYDFSNEKYDKEVAYTVMQWLLAPPEPARDANKTKG